MPFKDVGTLIFIAICFVYCDCAPRHCIPLVKEAVLHSYSTSGTICKREAPFYDFGEPVSLQKRSVPLTDEDSTESALKTLEELEKEESQDWFDQFTYNEIEEMLDVAERVIRAGISRNDIISFTGKCCENLDICRMNPKNYIRC